MFLNLSVEFSETNPEIFIDILYNNNLVMTDTFSKGFKDFTVEFEDTDEHTEQCITFTMRGKTEQHTIVENNDIVSDVYAMIKNITIDEIDVTDLYTEGALCYHHVGSNNKQNGPMIIDEFYGFIGFNGDVKLEFTTPMWQWFNSKCS